MNVIEKRNKCTRITWIRTHVISKRVLTFGRNLNIISCFELAISHIIIIHSHKCGIMICFGIAVAAIKNKHIILILLFSYNIILKCFPVLFRFLSGRAKLFSLTYVLRCFNRLIIFFYLMI